ncbi:UDP-N-acetylglucosamine 2-epimerase [Methylotuvimicrobium sp.]|uniref:UDP-N-acetylglucosamine 2-epimerase n=1 Tax=Methylotuvimicrobium sp. TaxID=2822413 RepID=UPI003D66065B
MSKVFSEELDIPHPKYNLEISGGQHGAMTGRMLEAVENVLLEEKPDWVLIYGDTKFYTGWCSGGGQGAYSGSPCRSRITLFQHADARGS